jgi:hypothetical protein
MGNRLQNGGTHLSVFVFEELRSCRHVAAGFGGAFSAETARSDYNPQMAARDASRPEQLDTRRV